jgi:hypothetical protein
MTELVLVADVVSIHPRPHEPGVWATTNAHLRGRTLLQGKTPGDTVRLPGQSGGGCDPTLAVGDRVLAFLRRDESGQEWTALRLQVVEDAVAKVSVARINEYLAILEERSPSVRRRLTARWLTKMVEHPATRRDGLRELRGNARGKRRCS